MVALESASNAPLRFLMFPLSSVKPARCETATKVPAVSNTSTSRRAKITGTNATSRAARMSSSNSTGAIEGGADTSPPNSEIPVAQPSSEARRMPIMIAPKTCLALKMMMSVNPIRKNRVSGRATLARVTMVASLPSTMPALCSAINPIKKPMPAEMPRFRFMGMLLMSHSRIGTILMTTKITPEIKTAPSAVCHG